MQEGESIACLINRDKRQHNQQYTIMPPVNEVGAVHGYMNAA